ncbi:MAG: hypothetical protein M3220_10775 [Chloroflexota bacterium]|nr:hypothetical protein [Chloroflexota bacterium]
MTSRPDREGSPHPATPLHVRWLSLARLGWLGLVSLTLAVVAAGSAPHWQQLQTPCAVGHCTYFQLTYDDARALAELGLSLDFYAWHIVALALCTIAVLISLAALLISRQSGSRMALFVAFALVALGPTFFAALSEALVQRHPLWHWPVGVLQAFGLWCLVSFGYLFPNGRFVPPWTRWLALFLVLPVLAIGLASLPTVVSATTAAHRLLLLVLLSGMVVGAVVQIYRYRQVSSPLEKQQTKWVVFGFSLFILVAVMVAVVPLSVAPVHQPGLPRALYYLVGGTLLPLFLLLFLLTFALAILHYRLYDIDLLIRRTLIYALLTLALALVYFGTVIAVQYLFRALTHQNSDVAIVVSTLAIAALFNPLRHRIQDFIDRRFYRRKYDAQKTLAAFSQTVRHEVELDKLTGELVRVIEETLQPAHISLWLRSDVPPLSEEAGPSDER